MNRIEKLADKYKQQRAVSAETNISLRIYDEKKEEFIEKKEIWLLGRVFENRSIILKDDDGIDRNVEEVKTALDEMYKIAKKYIKLNNK